MNIRNIFAAILIVASTCLGAVGNAVASEVFASVGFMEGSQSFTDTFTLPSAGTLTVELTNVAWPTPLASLNMLISSSAGSLGPEMGAGVATFTVDAGGTYVAQLFGQAQGALNAGVYAVDIQFQPSTVPVPLPTSIVLLLSGIALLIWQRRAPRPNYLNAV